MTQAEAMRALQDAWEQQWPTLRPGASFAFENEKFRGAEPLWALLFVRHTVPKQLSMGREGMRRFEYAGNIFVLLYGSVELGRGPVDEAVEDVRTIYQAKTVIAGKTVWTKTAMTTEGKLGKTTDGLWFQEQVTIPFKYFGIG